MEVVEVDSASSEIDFCEKLDQLCEYYMAMGVSFDEFWHGDYCRLKYYEKAYFHNLDKRNYEIWLQGAVFYKAIDVALAQGFGGNERAKYPTYNEFIGKSETDGMSDEELWQYIQQQLEDEAKRYEQTHRSN